MIDTKDPRVVGGRYYSDRWQREHTVLAKEYHDETFWLTVHWDDKKVTTHCTAWDPHRDKVVREP